MLNGLKLWPSWEMYNIFIMNLNSNQKYLGCGLEKTIHCERLDCIPFVEIGARFTATHSTLQVGVIFFPEIVLWKKEIYDVDEDNR